MSNNSPGTGPCCAKCGKPLDVRRGRFIHAYPDRVANSRKGFHIPQLIMPSVVKNPVRWAKIHEMKLRQGGNRKFLQEVLGIAVEEGEREITKKNLQDICILGHDLGALRRKAQQGEYEFIVSGTDWGGSDYIPAQHIKISTTVHVIMGVTPTRKMDLLHIRRYSGMNYDDIVGDILRNHIDFRGTAMASDFGVGAVYNSKLREKIPPEQHLIFNYVVCMANCNSGLLCSVKTPLYTLKVANRPKTRVSGTRPHLPRDSATMSGANLALGPMLLKLNGSSWLTNPHWDPVSILTLPWPVGPNELCGEGRALMCDKFRAYSAAKAGGYAFRPFIL